MLFTESTVMFDDIPSGSGVADFFVFFCFGGHSTGMKGRVYPYGDFFLRERGFVCLGLLFVFLELLISFLYSARPVGVHPTAIVHCRNEANARYSCFDSSPFTFSNLR